MNEWQNHANEIQPKPGILIESGSSILIITQKLSKAKDKSLSQEN